MIRFASANIKGTPPMPAQHALQDLQKAMQRADVLVLQEFRHRSYWRKAIRKRPRWRSYPGFAAAIARPNRAAGAVLWRARRFSKVNQACRVLHEGRAGVSETRYLRAVRLREKKSKRTAWYGGCHFVVKGDRIGSPELRQKILYTEDIPRFEEFISGLLATGDPVIWGMDANIRHGTPGYKVFLAAVERLGGFIYGARGVEFTFVFPGRDHSFHVNTVSSHPAKDLHTDHEIRLLAGELKEPRKARP